MFAAIGAGEVPGRQDLPVHGCVNSISPSWHDWCFSDSPSRGQHNADNNPETRLDNPAMCSGPSEPGLDPEKGFLP